jgi:DNA transposition AAA+ family ATPase
MAATSFIETREYRKFAEFCDDCRRYRYIGLCYGPPGVGKTLSARHYATWSKVESCSRVASQPKGIDARSVFHTVPVSNSPRQIDIDLMNTREHLRNVSPDMRKLEKEMNRKLAKARRQEKISQPVLDENRDWLKRSESVFASQPTVGQVTVERSRRIDAIKDPTRLIIVDEADRLRMSSMEQVRAVFDQGDIGLILIGMPGLEKRLARYPQLYSRVGFVHEFRTLQSPEMLELLHREWRPRGIPASAEPWADDEGMAAIVRVTGGNFRLLDRLLRQIERVLRINKLGKVTRDVVDAARESLVIGVE